MKPETPILQINVQPQHYRVLEGLVESLAADRDLIVNSVVSDSVFEHTLRQVYTALNQRDADRAAFAELALVVRTLLNSNNRSMLEMLLRPSIFVYMLRVLRRTTLLSSLFQKFIGKFESYKDQRKHPEPLDYEKLYQERSKLRVIFDMDEDVVDKVKIMIEILFVRNFLVEPETNVVLDYMFRQILAKTNTQVQQYLLLAEKLDILPLLLKGENKNFRLAVHFIEDQISTFMYSDEGTKNCILNKYYETRPEGVVVTLFQQLANEKIMQDQLHTLAVLETLIAIATANEARFLQHAAHSSKALPDNQTGLYVLGNLFFHTPFNEVRQTIVVSFKQMHNSRNLKESDMPYYSQLVRGELGQFIARKIELYCHEPTKLENWDHIVLNFLELSLVWMKLEEGKSLKKTIQMLSSNVLRALNKIKKSKTQQLLLLSLTRMVVQNGDQHIGQSMVLWGIFEEALQIYTKNYLKNNLLSSLPLEMLRYVDVMSYEFSSGASRVFLKTLSEVREQLPRTRLIQSLIRKAQKFEEWKQVKHHHDSRYLELLDNEDQQLYYFDSNRNEEEDEAIYSRTLNGQSESSEKLQQLRMLESMRVSIQHRMEEEDSDEVPIQSPLQQIENLHKDRFPNDQKELITSTQGQISFTL